MVNGDGDGKGAVSSQAHRAVEATSACFRVDHPGDMESPSIPPPPGAEADSPEPSRPSQPSTTFRSLSFKSGRRGRA